MTRYAYATRIESFCTVHRMHSKVLSDGDNKRIFGKCNCPEGHEHQFKLEVTVRGPISADDGMVMNLEDLKIIIKQLTDTVDHKNLNTDVPFFQHAVTSTENIALYIWDFLKERLPKETAQLYEVKVHETDKNVVYYRGE